MSGDERRRTETFDPNRWRVRAPAIVNRLRAQVPHAKPISPPSAARLKQVCDVSSLGLGKLSYHDETDNEHIAASIESERPAKCGPCFDKFSPPSNRDGPEEERQANGPLVSKFPVGINGAEGHREAESCRVEG